MSHSNNFLDIENLHYEKKNVGKTFQSSKVCHIWEFSLFGKYHVLKLFDSRLSGKKKLQLDEKVLFFLEEDSMNIQYKFKLNKVLFYLYQVNDKDFELKIEGKFFNEYVFDERSGIHRKQKEEYFRRKARENEKKKENKKK